MRCASSNRLNSPSGHFCHQWNKMNSWFLIYVVTCFTLLLLVSKLKLVLVQRKSAFTSAHSQASRHPDISCDTVLVWKRFVPKVTGKAQKKDVFNSSHCSMIVCHPQTKLEKRVLTETEMQITSLISQESSHLQKWNWKCAPLTLSCLVSTCIWEC